MAGSFLSSGQLRHSGVVHELLVLRYACTWKLLYLLKQSCCSVAKSCPTLRDPMTAAHQVSLSLTISRSLPKFMSIDLVMPSNHLILCRPLQSFWATESFPMSLFLTSGGQSIGVSSSASVLPMNIQDWFPLGSTGWISLQSKGLQHHSSKASILQRSAFFVFQLSHSYMTTGKTIALTTWTFFGKVCLCFLICCLGWSQLFFKGASIF